MDEIVRGALSFAASNLPSGATTEVASPVTVVAVGGYGRAEMAPYSDVDLLFLTAPRATEDSNALVEATLYLLWDLGLKVGLR